MLLLLMPSTSCLSGEQLTEQFCRILTSCLAYGPVSPLGEGVHGQGQALWQLPRSLRGGHICAPSKLPAPAVVAATLSA